jgi:hypothetical protein
VLRNAFKKADFMACLIELIKNSDDAHATTISITTANKQEFRMVDDGNGMDERGRLAYLHAGYSTGDGNTSAKFGTGARMLPFSYASHVRISTVSAAEPGVVYRCEFTPDELLEYYTDKRDIDWVRIKKTEATWPHVHATGVDVTYTFEDASRRGILRGSVLRRRLTDRLSIAMVEGNTFLVDGKCLPPKEYAADTKPLVFMFKNEKAPQMGRVRFEFYRLDKPRSGDLTMTARSVGEVSFRRKFVNLLPDDIRSQVPELFLQEGVCGLITADYLNEHVAHQRDEYQGAEDDGRTIWLLGLLAQVEDQVAEALKINVRHIDEKDATGRKEVTALLASLDDRYSRPDQVPPSGGEGKDEHGDSRKEGGSAGGPKQRTAHFRLNQPEFELGEEIIATLVVSNGSPEDYEVFCEESLAKLVDGPKEGTVRLIAETLGTGKLVARHRVTKSTVRVTYEVMRERWFRLQAPSAALIGEQVWVNAYNIDKVPGGVKGIEWEVLGGDITLGNEDRSVTFVAERPGLATVSAYAKEDSTICDDRDILVSRSQADTPKAFRIRDQFFVLRFDGAMGQERYSKPVTIIKDRGYAHRLTFTTDEPGYAKASRDGVLPIFLIPYIAREYADHFYEGNPEDGELYQWGVSCLAAEVAAEMFGAKEVVVD